MITINTNLGESFPRAREYFHLNNRYDRRGRVFPACAGVFPIGEMQVVSLLCLSRVRGSISPL